MNTSPQPYTIVIGLETHVQLMTNTKLFCRCSTRFGSLPNTQTCPVCIGMPGSLPVMNGKAFQLALKTAVALNCEIPEFTKWDRKHYYYPDLPKAYQISQYDLPMSENGWLQISDPQNEFEPKRVGLIRAHLEEDAGKSTHDEQAGKADSQIDLNRTGTPLLEIVTQPDLRSPQEAKAFLTELKLLLSYLGVSDCNMQEGSLRVDANVNLHVEGPEGVIATPIVEVKNMNSFRAVERALVFEAQRQFEDWQSTGQRLGDVPKQTRGWDEKAQVTKGQRSKEESSDYRYFPDPDLLPVVVSPGQVQQIRDDLGELPAVIRQRLESDFAITPYDANVIVNQGRDFVSYFVQLAEGCGDGKLAANWMQRDVQRVLNDEAILIDQFSVPAASLADLLKSVRGGLLDSSRASEVFSEMCSSGASATEAMKSLGIEEIDSGQVVQLCRELLAANQPIVEDVKNGKTKAIGRLIGEAKKKNPNVNPTQVREICLELIKKM